MTTVYKVVRRRQDGKLASDYIRRGRCEVIYQPQEPSCALNGMKLLAFRTKRDALRYKGVSPSEIWKAKATKVRRQAFLHFLRMDWRGFKKFWKHQDPDDPGNARTSLGTVACDSITLIKRVDGEPCS